MANNDSVSWVQEKAHMLIGGCGGLYREEAQGDNYKYKISVKRRRVETVYTYTQTCHMRDSLSDYCILVSAYSVRPDILSLLNYLNKRNLLYNTNHGLWRSLKSNNLLLALWIVSHDALFWNSQAHSVNDSMSDFDWVFLEIPLNNYIVKMLLTCPID